MRDQQPSAQYWLDGTARRLCGAQAKSKTWLRFPVTMHRATLDQIHMQKQKHQAHTKGPVF